MKKMKKIAAISLAAAMTIAMAGCGNSVPKNTVNSVDDLEGKKIGVQLGTTGDIYASDYEGDDAGTTIERYNMNRCGSGVKAGKSGLRDHR